MRWSVRDRLTAYELCLFHAVRPDERTRRFLDLAEARAFVERLVADGFSAAVLRTAARSIAPDGRDLAEDLAAELVARRLLIVESSAAPERRGVAGARPHAPRTPPETPPDEPPTGTEVDTDWIEIQLVDAEGEPVANTRYEITTPDGHTRRGYTDSLGTARLIEIPSGMCTVGFPDLDGREWSPVSSS
jgi:hypothetical protein